MRTKFGFAHEIAQRRGTSQSTRAMNQFSHRPRLSVGFRRRKLAWNESDRLADLTARSLHGSPCLARTPFLMNRATNYLLIDISNSFTKLAFASKKRVGPASRIETDKLTGAFLRSFIKCREIDMFVVCSVVPKKNRAITLTAGKTKVLWLGPGLRLGVGIDYPAPKTIGADRLANAAAVAALYGTPAIVVDFGTAVTFDIVSRQRKYIGGVIAPGLEAMTSFLYQRTALLPRLSLKEPRRAIGRSTIEAMRAGAVFGYRGLVREVIVRIKAEVSPRGKIKVVATGGYAALIASRLPEIKAVHPHLTLEGLRIVANLNDQSRKEARKRTNSR
jgi:type III pantothenate kinase